MKVECRSTRISACTKNTKRWLSLCNHVFLEKESQTRPSPFLVTGCTGLSPISLFRHLHWATCQLKLGKCDNFSFKTNASEILCFQVLAFQTGHLKELVLLPQHGVEAHHLMVETPLSELPSETVPFQ